MKRILVFLAFALIAACAPAQTDVSPAPLATPTLPLAVTRTPTPDPVQFYYDINVSQATAQAAQATAEWYSSRATATSAAISAASTATVQARQASQTQAAFAAQTTATARAWNATATADSIQSTATAAATGTARAMALAATVQSMQITATAQAAQVSAYATAMAGQAESVRLAVERERRTNQLKAFAPWALLLLTALVVGVVMLRRSRIMLIDRDARGDARLLLIGGRYVYDPDRNPAPVVDLGGTHPSLPIPADPATVARDQAIDMAHRGLPDGKTQRPSAAKSIPAPANTPPAGQTVNISLVAPETVSKAIDDVMPPLLLDVVEREIS